MRRGLMGCPPAAIDAGVWLQRELCRPAGLPCDRYCATHPSHRFLAGLPDGRCRAIFAHPFPMRASLKAVPVYFAAILQTSSSKAPGRISVQMIRQSCFSILPCSNASTGRCKMFVASSAQACTCCRYEALSIICAALKKLDAGEPGIGPDDFAIPLNASISGQQEREPARQVGCWVRDCKACAFLGHIPDDAGNRSFTSGKQSHCGPTHRAPPRLSIIRTSKDCLLQASTSEPSGSQQTTKILKGG
jgi:hypothetical protein